MESCLIVGAACSRHGLDPGTDEGLDDQRHQQCREVGDPTLLAEFICTQESANHDGHQESAYQGDNHLSGVPESRDQGA